MVASAQRLTGDVLKPCSLWLHRTSLFPLGTFDSEMLEKNFDLLKCTLSSMHSFFLSVPLYSFYPLYYKAVESALRQRCTLLINFFFKREREERVGR